METKFQTHKGAVHANKPNVLKYFDFFFNGPVELFWNCFGTVLKKIFLIMEYAYSYSRPIPAGEKLLKYM